MHRRLRLEPTVFYGLLLAALLPIWAAGRFFVTGDGPCHVYNSRVLLDFVLGRDLDFYKPFYFLNLNFDPNWFSHLCLAALQLVLAPEVAEKVFLSGYVLLFGFGLRYLLRQINPESLFLSSVGLLFCWHNLLQAGFYNYASSVAMFFWVGGYWLRHRAAMTPVRILTWALLWVLQYSMHPVGLVFSGVFVAAAVLMESLGAMRDGARLGSFLLLKERTLTALAGALPTVLLFAEYLYRKEWPKGANADTFSEVWRELRELATLTTLLRSERMVVLSVALGVAALFLTAIWQRVRARRWQTHDFLLLWLAFGLAYYFQQAGQQSLELLMPQRLQIFPWLGLLLWSATATFPQWARRLVMGGAVLVMLMLLAIRLPVHRQASALAEDMMACIPLIDDRSAVLVLNYDIGGANPQGGPIANRNYLFVHIADYIGAYRTAIMSDNYEALRFYFPLIWHWERDMFQQTDKDGINFLHDPPRADMLSFERRTGQKLPYVLILGNPSEEKRNHPYTQEIQAQLAQAYELVFTSGRGAARLYRLKQ